MAFLHLLEVLKYEQTPHISRPGRNPLCYLGINNVKSGKWFSKNLVKNLQSIVIIFQNKMNNTQAIDILK